MLSTHGKGNESFFTCENITDSNVTIKPFLIFSVLHFTPFWRLFPVPQGFGWVLQWSRWIKGPSPRQLPPVVKLGGYFPDPKSGETPTSAKTDSNQHFVAHAAMWSATPLTFSFCLSCKKNLVIGLDEPAVTRWQPKMLLLLCTTLRPVPDT